MPEPKARPFTPPLARDTDPETSHDAANSVAGDGTVETHERRILAVLREMPRGGTASEIAEAVRERWRIDREILFCAHTVSRRFAALLAARLIHRRRDDDATARARAKDPKARPRPIRRDGQIVHFYGAGDLPLWAE